MVDRPRNFLFRAQLVCTWPYLCRVFCLHDHTQAGPLLSRENVCLLTLFVLIVNTKILELCVLALDTVCRMNVHEYYQDKRECNREINK
jgi:hypothetical protein